MEDSAIHNSTSRNTGGRGAERGTHDDDDDEEEDVPEESGWTVYFDDFFSNNREIVLENNVSPSSSSGFSGSPSMVSDAASIAAWNKLASDAVVGQSSIVRTDQVTSKKLRLLKKKKKKKGIVRGGGVIDIEDALEDTASSPVNSPKVSDHHMMKQFDHLMNTPRKNDDHTSCSSSSLRRNKQRGGGVLGGHFSEMQTDERNNHHHHFLAEGEGGGGGGGGGGQGFNGRENECTELKKKGLCLVPMSMLVNYFG